MEEYRHLIAFGRLFKPALEVAMTENLSEVERIANNPAAPTFDNTIAEMERAGRTFDRVGTLYGVWAATMNGPEFQVVQREMAPRLAAFSDQINQNAALFRRIETVYSSPDKARLTPEQQRLTWLYYTNFVRAGARLNAQAKNRLSQINQQLAGLASFVNMCWRRMIQFWCSRPSRNWPGFRNLCDAAAQAATTRSCRVPG
jgi:peptidyl-dipeptidase Dcp